MFIFELCIKLVFAALFVVQRANRQDFVLVFERKICALENLCTAGMTEKCLTLQSKTFDEERKFVDNQFFIGLNFGRF